MSTCRRQIEKCPKNSRTDGLASEKILAEEFHSEHWGWGAIHLANLYSGRLNQPDKAVALLHRIDAEFTKTAAARR
ncbi:MAG: hypothetical protein HYY24_18190 [Verrucomicrobia bacterium]|nr:hypothetical protein [Verrucomicrobiota bacterium]